MFKVLHSGKRKKKAWKRMVTKVTFVGPSFTRKPPKYERFIRPSGERLIDLFGPNNMRIRVSPDGRVSMVRMCPRSPNFRVWLCRSAHEEGTCDAP